VAIAPAYPLTLYYDGACGLCVAEMTALARADLHGRLRLVDCSGPGFDDPDCVAAGIGVDALMHRLHARDADGHWRVGVPALSVAYGAIGIDGLARFFAEPSRAGWLGRAYGWIADHRQLLSRFGLNFGFRMWIQWRARRAARHAHACADGLCRLDHGDTNHERKAA
jgi:predicted DCC family thiol-disulfide oxidoreductase YuxK